MEKFSNGWSFGVAFLGSERIKPIDGIDFDPLDNDFIQIVGG